MEIIADFLCMHINENYASLEEIISQVPDQLIEYANAFEVIEGSKLRDGLISRNTGLHLSKVRTYKINK